MEMNQIPVMETQKEELLRKNIHLLMSLGPHAVARCHSSKIHALLTSKPTFLKMLGFEKINLSVPLSPSDATC